jgi:hypothetical protein
MQHKLCTRHELSMATFVSIEDWLESYSVEKIEMFTPWKVDSPTARVFENRTLEQ